MPQTRGYVYDPNTNETHWLDYDQFRPTGPVIVQDNKISFWAAKWYGQWVPVLPVVASRPPHLRDMADTVYRIADPDLARQVRSSGPFLVVEMVSPERAAVSRDNLLAEISRWLDMHDGWIVALEICRSGVPLRIELDDDGTVVNFSNPEDPE